MYVIQKEFAFSAAHQLAHLPAAHPCSRLHGHNYRVIVVLRSEDLNQDFFVRDYNELKTLKDFLDSVFDHRNLNEVLNMPTTAENIAKYLFYFCVEKWPETYSVRVSETDKTWAEYIAEE